MFLSIKNVGKISSADIEISGITVMAGVNNTGKSTVGKVLFSLFNSFYKIDKQIEHERIDRVVQILISYLHDVRSDFIEISDPHEFAARVVKAKKTKKENLESEICDLLTQGYDNSDLDASSSIISTTVDKILQILNVSDEEIFVSVLKDRLYAEFNMQINNILQPELKSEIKLKIKDKEVVVTVSGNELVEISNNFSLNTEVIYLDDPLALDNPRLAYPSSEDHRRHLIRKLQTKRNDSPVGGAIDKIITSKRMDAIFTELDKVCEGKILDKSNFRRHETIMYGDGDSKTALNIKNVSTGVKAFAILKTLLLNGSLEDNGTIILDEPEVHLHPEWQLVFAKLIVLLHKEFNMHILINTHSPYFLDAIDVYSHAFGVSKKCKYYLAEDDGGTATITDVSDNLEKIYDRLSRPFQILENERYRDE